MNQNWLFSREELTPKPLTDTEKRELRPHNTQCTNRPALHVQDKRSLRNDARHVR